MKKTKLGIMDTKITSNHLFLISFLFFVMFCAYMYGSIGYKCSVLSENSKPWSLVRGLAHTSPPEDPQEPWIETLSWSPRVFLYHNILTDEECDEIINIAGNDVTRSKVVGGGKGDSVESNVRTSHGTFLLDNYMKQYPLLRDVERRIAEWSKLPVENGEAFYLLRYELGQEYKPHVDFFSGSADNYVGEEGDRCATVLLYLHTPDEGGETTFPKAKLLVPAKKGNAVLFWDQEPDNKADSNALHGGTPVLKGIKWAMTKWIRVNKFWHYSKDLSEEERKRIEYEDKLYLESKNLY